MTKRPTIKQDIPIVWTMDDFGQISPRGYWCEAMQGDMRETLALLPKFGGYVINQRQYKKVHDIGKTGRNQEQRGKKLLEDLTQKTLNAMTLAGWIVVETNMHYTLYRRV